MRRLSGKRLALPVASSVWLAASVAWAQNAPIAQPPVPAHSSDAPKATRLTASSDFPAESTRIGTFKQVQGESWVGAASARRFAEPGAAVFEAEHVSTGPTGAATFTLKDGTVLTMSPNSSLLLSQFKYDAMGQKGNFALDLIQGSVRVVTGLLAKINPDQFKIFTPTSVVGVRGTDFIVEARAEPSPTVQATDNLKMPDQSATR